MEMTARAMVAGRGAMANKHARMTTPAWPTGTMAMIISASVPTLRACVEVVQVQLPPELI